MPKLADTRKPKTLDDAKKLLTTLRQLTCEREVILATAEKEIAEITANAEEKTAPLDAQIKQREAELTEFILANRSLFKKPRKVKTPDGTFGLQNSERVEITDEEQALEFLWDRGYDECIKTTRSFIKPKIRARIDSGERIPGCKIDRGEIASYKIAEALIKEARANV